MQEISIHEFTFSKAAQTLTAEVSDLSTTRFDLDAAVNRIEPFVVNGANESRTYQFYDVQREGARHEVGDITAWLFRCVDGFGRAMPGPRMVILND